MFPDKIDVNGEAWHIESKIGGGGFGFVYSCKSESGIFAAVKFVSKELGSENELKQELFKNPKNIVPIWAVGELADYYFVLMPLAETSLFERSKIGFDESAKLKVLFDIAEALDSICDEAVHRDLKPENILLLGDTWCVADFGLMRFKEEATRGHTRKNCFTEAYASPEQWNWDRATPATDIYSFGILAYELIEGRLPFDGADIRRAHLMEQPPEMLEGPTWLRSLILSCISKSPASRPSARSVLQQLNAGITSGSNASEKLRKANLSVMQANSKKGAEHAMQAHLAQSRRELFDGSLEILNLTINELRTQIMIYAPLAEIVENNLLFIRLGNAELDIGYPEFIDDNEYNETKILADIDVIAATAIRLVMIDKTNGYAGGVHSLWYCDAETKGRYRWYETAFYNRKGPVQNSAYLSPIALSPINRKVALAINGEFSDFQVDWNPRPCDQLDVNQFVDRWIGWFADAVEGTLKYWMDHPSRDVGAWREY
jgi:eukaryotic-like serine/threonine-protein kinase